MVRPVALPTSISPPFTEIEPFLLVSEVLPSLVLLLPEMVMEPPSACSEPPLMLSSDPLRFNVPWLALMAPLEDVAPVLRTSMCPPPLAAREEPLPTLVALEVEVAVAEGPARTPPTTMRWAGVAVEAAGAVAVTAVAPRTLVMPCAVAGAAAPEKI